MENNQNNEIKNEVTISMEKNEKNEFSDKISPVEIEDAKELFLFQCKCGNIHYRHAGYVEILMPYINADRTKNVSNDSLQVMVCTKCRKSYVWLNQQMYDLSKLIDVQAWEKAEKEMHSNTGPGGQC
jgi:hypothetical protein